MIYNVLWLICGIICAFIATTTWLCLHLIGVYIYDKCGKEISFHVTVYVLGPLLYIWTCNNIWQTNNIFFWSYITTTSILIYASYISTWQSMDEMLCKDIPGMTLGPPVSDKELFSKELKNPLWHS